MPTFVDDETRFWQWSPAAAKVFGYRRQQPALGDMPWGFDRGGISDDRKSTWAEFSCVSVTGRGKDELVITAVAKEDGTWTVKHTITRAS